MSATGAGEAPADVEAAGLEEGEDHAAADDELVHLGEQRLDHADLGRHLRAPAPRALRRAARRRGAAHGEGTLEPPTMAAKGRLGLLTAPSR